MEKYINNWYKLFRVDNSYLNIVKKVVNTISQMKHNKVGDYEVLRSSFPFFEYTYDPDEPTVMNHLLSLADPLNVDDRVINALKDATDGRLKDFVIYPTLNGKLRLHYNC